MSRDRDMFAGVFARCRARSCLLPTVSRPIRACLLGLGNFLPAKSTTIESRQTCWLPLDNQTSCDGGKLATLFFSYSHVDENLRDQLEIHLTSLRRQGLIDSWHDRRITAGEDFGDAIDRHIDTADVILLLVS